MEPQVLSLQNSYVLKKLNQTRDSTRVEKMWIDSTRVNILYKKARTDSIRGKKNLTRLGSTREILDSIHDQGRPRSIEPKSSCWVKQKWGVGFIAYTFIQWVGFINEFKFHEQHYKCCLVFKSQMSIFEEKNWWQSVSILWFIEDLVKSSSQVQYLYLVGNQHGPFLVYGLEHFIPFEKEGPPLQLG